MTLCNKLHSCNFEDVCNDDEAMVRCLFLLIYQQYMIRKTSKFTHYDDGKYTKGNFRHLIFETSDYTQDNVSRRNKVHKVGSDTGRVIYHIHTDPI